MASANRPVQQDHDRGETDRETMDRVTCRIPTSQINEVEALVDAGVYPNRSEAIRDAVRQLVAEKASDSE